MSPVPEKLVTKQNRPLPHPNGGFTIVELLIASALSLVVLGLMVQITFSTLQTFDKVTGTLNTKKQAQFIFDYLRRDFGSIVWRQDGNVWLLATVQPDQDASNSGRGDTNMSDADWSVGGAGTYKPGIKTAGNDDSSLRLEKPGGIGTDRWIDLAEYRFGQAGVWLRFFTNQITDSETSAAPVAVSYQIVRNFPQRNQTNDRERRYLLFRSVVKPGPDGTAASQQKSVLNSGYDLTSPTYNEIPATATNGLPASVRKPDREVMLALNVLDFGVRFWRRDPATGRNILIFPASGNGSNNLPSNANLGYAVTGDQPADANYDGQPSTNILRFGATPHSGHLSTVNFQTAGETQGGYPDYVEVMVRILTDEGARIIAAYENGDQLAPNATTQAARDTYWWTLAEQHSTVFIDTIPLPARPF